MQWFCRFLLRGRIVLKLGGNCPDIGGELSGANCPRGELSGYPQHWCSRLWFVLLAQRKIIEKSVMGESLLSDSILDNRFSILDERFSILDTRFSQESRIESRIETRNRLSTYF